LDIKLLTPTVVVSLLLIGVSLFGTLYLDSLHVNVSEALTENVESTRAADSLETITRDLMRLLRRPTDPAGLRNTSEFREKIEEQNEEAKRERIKAEEHADHPEERDLVPRISAGLQQYLDGWDKRPTMPAAQLASYDAALADDLEKEVLPWCIELRQYNAGQIRRSDDENQRIISWMKWGLIAVGVGGPVCGLVLGFGVARSLRRSIYQLSVRIRDAAGRLSREVGSVTLKEESELPDLHRQMRGVIQEIGRVIDQLEQREREVLRAEQLAAVGQVAAGVAHELRNPLTSIKLLVQTGLEGNPPPGLAAEELALIEREIRRIERRFQTFLDFARPPRSERRRADLLEVVRRALALVEGRARLQKVALATDLPAEPVWLTIDPEQVHQVVLNLLLNALDVLPRGGTVEVAVLAGAAGSGDPRQAPGAAGSGGPRRAPDKRQAPDPRRAPAGAGDLRRVQDGEVAVQVRDSGPGILPHIRSRLFEPFVSSKDTGLGLGLSICKRLIEDHGGTIRGTSGRDGGTVFTFTLPREEAHAHAADRR
jgi:signal transduction histidine kinase